MLDANTLTHLRSIAEQSNVQADGLLRIVKNWEQPLTAMDDRQVFLATLPGADVAAELTEAAKAFGRLASLLCQMGCAIDRRKQEVAEAMRRRCRREPSTTEGSATNARE